MEAMDLEALAKQTGYRNFPEALHKAQNEKDGNAMWFCLEIVRPLVYGSIALYVEYARQKSLTSQISLRDIEQTAFESLIKAMQKFTIPENIKDDDIQCRKAWNKYASLTIKSPIRDAYSASLGQVRVPDWALKISASINAAIRDIEAEQWSEESAPVIKKLVGEPHLDARVIAAKAGLEYSKVKRYLDNGLHFLPNQRFLPDEYDHPDRIESEIDKSEKLNPALEFTEGQEALLGEAWRHLNSRQQFVISALYGLEGRTRTYRGVAKELQLDEEDVKLLEAAALAQLQEAFLG